MPDFQAQQDSIFTVSQFTRFLKQHLEGLFPQIRIRGEISNFSPSSAGHWYFQLKDENASVRAIIFRNATQAVISSLSGEGYKRLEDGMEVVAEGKLNVYEKRGEYSIIVHSLYPAGRGELAVRFEMLKNRLQAEGLFDQAHKKDLPDFPRHVGIVTSPTGAALQDILNVLKRRFSALRITVFPARVQGDGAAPELVKAIRYADYLYREDAVNKPDVLIVARGGGSIEDLWPFNEEIVGRAIFEAEIPLITGIGHEVDFTIADFCADLRAPTPSAAAEIVVKNSGDLLNTISGFALRIEGAMERLLQQHKFRMQRCAPSRLTQLFERIYQTGRHGHALAADRLERCFEKITAERSRRFELAVRKLDSLSPLKTLSRGYSVITDNEGTVITNAASVSEGERLRVILSRGELGVEVYSTTPPEEQTVQDS